jgi:hypothetical protein
MHRLLIVYERTAVVVWSLNKNSALSSLNIRETTLHQGDCLAVEWYNEN